MKIVEFQDVSKSYVMGTVRVDALCGVTFTIEEGEHVAITGPSGSGKSTLLNLLGCLDSPSSGLYLLGGQDVSNLDDNALSEVRRDRIGFVFQSFNLIPRLSVLENVEMPLFYAGLPVSERRQRAIQIAEMVGLGSRARHKPSELSGGECQRVAIARALANNPIIILADEPTGNLDTRTGAEILGLLREVWHKGATLIVVTHDEKIASQAPRRIHLTDGQVLKDWRQAVSEQQC